MISEIVFWLMVIVLLLVILGLWHEAVRQYRIEDLPPLTNGRKQR